MDELSEKDKAFHALADAQRGKPEMAMLRAQDAGHKAQAGNNIDKYPSMNAFTYALEHVGDLTHRMSERYATKARAGLEYVAPKVKLGLSITGNPTDSANIRKLPQLPEFDAYSKAHSELPVYNKAQYHAREAAVALGHRNLFNANDSLQILQNMIDRGDYEHHASQYDPDFEKKYTKKDADAERADAMHQKHRIAMKKIEDMFKPREETPPGMARSYPYTTR